MSTFYGESVVRHLKCMVHTALGFISFKVVRHLKMYGAYSDNMLVLAGPQVVRHLKMYSAYSDNMLVLAGPQVVRHLKMYSAYSLPLHEFLQFVVCYPKMYGAYSTPERVGYDTLL